MRPHYIVALVLPALALAACDKAAPPPSEQTSSAATANDALPVMGPERPILAFGDSLLAGYGLNDGESYPARLEQALRARGINARITNAGVSGDTTAAGLQRLDFTLSSQTAKPELAIISLGGNDMLRSLPPAQTRENLEAILKRFKDQNVRVVLLGLLAAPNLGKDYAAQFNPIYPQLAQKYGAVLVPFFLQPVIDKPDLMQKDHVHPTAIGVDAIVSATVDDVAGALPKKG
ncbi:putative acyl-CoA thioesterase I protein [Novosphingobium sp. Rr 2-17]|uniref:arylesterase n=1 Tax=Novosphingobium sp. Rr 2-17 TaxID=555793 RepID=UPI0002699F49|nr:arylesterase [Novosphingobium sp. Rr 2-17]EIZ77362.1 putative acyl-CoA thioesterase I protein [Novosphingobium sp. Rr 2-17]